MNYKINPAVTGGFWVRLMAFALDNIIILLMRSVFSLATLAITFLLPNPIFFSYSPLDIFYCVISVAYFTFTTYKLGATPGKLLFKLKVIDCSDSPGWLNILYRETIGRFLNGILSLGYIFLIVDKEHCTFADKLCDTRVVYQNLYARNVI